MTHNLEEIDPDDDLINTIFPNNDSTDNSNYYSTQHLNSLDLSPYFNFSLFNCNIRSYHKNGVSFQALFNSLSIKPSFIILTETWNSEENSKLCMFDGYRGTHVFRERSGGRGGGIGGGVSIFYDDSLSGDVVKDLCICDSTIEICVCRVNFGGSYILLLGIYRPHSDTPRNFVSRLEAILNHEIVKKASLVLVAGDMNINICDSAVSEEYLTLMQSHNFLPTITRPTRFSANNIDQVRGGAVNNCSNLDHIWLGKIEPYISGILLFDIVDHFPTFLLFNYKKNSSPDKVCIKSRPFSEHNFNALTNDLSNTNWDQVLCNKDKLLDVHDSCLNFINHLNKLYCNNFPLKIKHISTKRLAKPWLTQNLK